MRRLNSDNFEDMFGRVFLGLLTLISLLWLGYATYDRVNQGKQFNPEYLFGQEDGEVLIVLNPANLQLLSEQFGIQHTEMIAFLEQLNPDAIDDLYISKKRGQVLITTKETLDEKTILTVFSNQSGIRINDQSLSFGKLNGLFSKHAIYFSTESIELNKHPWQGLHYDKNSDASILQFSNKQQQPSVTDIYIKENGIIEYKTAVKQAVFGSKVNDKVVFSAVIPATVTSYEFYETDYLRFIDPELKKSPMNTWLKYGLVRVTVNGQEAIITDYIEGQEPIQVLYDFYKKESTDTESEYFEGEPLTQLMKATRGFYCYQVDDFVVISGNRAVCETIVGDYKLGNTLAQRSDRANEIYGQLPQKVNQRTVSGTVKQSVSVYDTNLLTTVVGGKAGSIEPTNQATTGSATSFVAGNIKDIHIIDENAFFVTTNDNKVLFFENDKKKWEQTLDGAIVGDAAIIDIFANEKYQLLVSSGKKVHVFDINGNEPGGFPIELDDQTNVQTPLFYRWKGNGFFAIAGTDGKLLQYDNQGRELAIVRNQLSEIGQQPVVWVSAGKPFIGLYGNGRFEMIQADNRRSLRIFDAREMTTIIKLPNEVKLFGVVNNQLVSYDQRGGITRYEKFVNAKLLPTINADKGIVVKDQQQLKLFNSGGIQWATLKLPFLDVSDVQVFSTSNGNTIIAVIDALENKVYLWKSNGELYSKQQWDGSKIVRYHNGALFTVVDNLVVRYSVK